MSKLTKINCHVNIPVAWKRTRMEKTRAKHFLSMVSFLSLKRERMKEQEK